MKNEKTSRRAAAFASATAVLLLAGAYGCGLQVPGEPEAGDEPTGLALEVATKASSVASQIGRPGGFGGELMTGYLEHMEDRMGFHGADDLADADVDMDVQLTNESTQDCTFHLVYYASHVGTTEQLLDVPVQAGDLIAISIPCSEIIGLGDLEAPGEVGCHLADDETVDNRMTVPGFVGQDFACGGTYACVLTPDVDDLDGDGDTEELIIISDAMNLHMMNGGPGGHMHGDGAGMMGSHMGL